MTPSDAGKLLAKIPRKEKRPWTGWIAGKHCRRYDKVILPDGSIRRIYGVVRNAVIVLKDPVPERWPLADLYSAAILKVYKDPAAVLLGRQKRGVKEKRSGLKSRSSRMNGSCPPRQGSRPRGRPRKI